MQLFIDLIDLLMGNFGAILGPISGMIDRRSRRLYPINGLRSWLRCGCATRDEQER